VAKLHSDIAPDQSSDIDFRGINSLQSVRRVDEHAGLVSVHAMLRREFAYMDERIDPPSSVGRLSVEDLSSGGGEVWAIGAPPLACVVLTPKGQCMYIGKLAVRSEDRGKGLARLLVDYAEFRARQLGHSWLELETRIELTENHRTFEAMGFSELERTSHPGYERVTSITYRRSVLLTAIPLT
jgi:GNAT superfamily N-acetyltransferase